MTKCFVNETPISNPIISYRLSKASFVPSFFQSERVRQMKKVSLGRFKDAAFGFLLVGFDCPGQGSILWSLLKEQCFTDLRLISLPNVCFLCNKMYSASQVQQDDARGSSFWSSQTYTPKPLGSLRCFMQLHRQTYLSDGLTMYTPASL